MLVENLCSPQGGLPGSCHCPGLARGRHGLTFSAPASVRLPTQTDGVRRPTAADAHVAGLRTTTGQHGAALAGDRTACVIDSALTDRRMLLAIGDAGRAVPCQKPRLDIVISGQSSRFSISLHHASSDRDACLVPGTASIFRR